MLKNSDKKIGNINQHIPYSSFFLDQIVSDSKLDGYDEKINILYIEGKKEQFKRKYYKSKDIKKSSFESNNSTKIFVVNDIFLILV